MQWVPSPCSKNSASQLCFWLAESESHRFQHCAAGKPRPVVHRLYCFYSNHRPEDAPFFDVLKNLETTNLNFRFIGTMTDMPRSRKAWDRRDRFHQKGNVVKIPKQLTGTCSTSQVRPLWLPL